MDDLISRQAAIDVVGIDEEIRCEICRNPMHTSRGCDGNCTYDEKLYEKIMQILDRRIKQMPSVQPERKKPVFKTGESVYHVSYADGTGGFVKNKWADWTCPDCGWFVGEQYIPRRRNQQKCNYCAKCGCAIDWSDADMRGEQE